MSANGKRIDLRDSDLYINRELSWIEFNKRVLDEAEDLRHPLLERLKFLAIFSSNLDEFFMVRVAGLKEQMDAGVVKLSADEMSVGEQLEEIRERLLPLIYRQEELLNNDILTELARHNVVLHSYESLQSKDKSYLKEYFIQKIFPVLTPLGLDPGHPFPQLANRSLNILFVVDEDKINDQRTAVLQLPQVLSRFVPLKRKTGYHFVLMEEVIQAHSEYLFPGLEVEESYAFRVTRDADIEIAEDEASDLLEEMEEQVRQRRWGAAVRLEIDNRMPSQFVEMLMDSLDLNKQDIYAVGGPRNIPDFMNLTKIDARSLKYPPIITRPHPKFHTEGISVFKAIRQQDLILFHPYDSFSKNYLKFIQTAATDPNVLAIKITLYRAGGDSPVIEVLKEAVMNGKQVTAIVELKARFDEENNIIWAKALEKAGVHVVYGLVGLKTHAKITMVVRKEDGNMRTYVHLSTGNYNHSTAKIYTDMAYFTAREDFGYDAMNLFNYLTGYSNYEDWDRFAVAPVNLSNKIIELIEREQDLHTKENPGEIYVKINALVDAKVIRALYKASNKGVKIKLLVRGICCLRPGIEDISENIEVRSILGRFLEHSRIFYFKNGGEEEIYMSSADWMPRNLYQRVEIMFPVLDPTVKLKLKKILDSYWKDNTKAHQLLPDATYKKLQPRDGEEEFIAQEFFLEELRNALESEVNRNLRTFPLEK